MSVKLVTVIGTVTDGPKGGPITVAAVVTGPGGACVIVVDADAVQS